MKRTLAAVAAIGCTAMAVADFEIDLDLSQAPIKDVRKTNTGTLIGYSGAFNGEKGTGPLTEDSLWFVSNRVETARAFRNCGAWLLRSWNAENWWRRRNDPKHRSNPEAAFRFFRENGIKTLLTIEARSDEAATNILELCRFIADNGYEKDVVVGFELGNENYAMRWEKLEPIGRRWLALIPEIRKILPKIDIGLPLAEYMENDPDVAQIRARMNSNESLHHGYTYDTGYFSAGELNRRSAQLIELLKPVMDEISHVVYHGYGAESPYSCSYWFVKRLHNFEAAYPEIKEKKWWLSEIRPRSDEDNRCQRLFREALIMGHYSLMMLCQPKVDCFNEHNLRLLSGGIYYSNGRQWPVQWMDGGKPGGYTYQDHRAPYWQPRLDIGAKGVTYRILTEAVIEHPLVMAHGTQACGTTEEGFFASSKFTDQVYKRRRAMKERRKTDGDWPKVEGDVEWVALWNGGSQLCLVMVNSTSRPSSVLLKAKDCEFCAPTYRTVTCPEKFLDCREVPGEAKPWRELAWEDTQTGAMTIPMEPYDGMKPEGGDLTVTIEPHTVQSVAMSIKMDPAAQKRIRDAAKAAAKKAAVERRSAEKAKKAAVKDKK